MGSVMGLVQIGEVADKFGVSTRTIKYYEELGLINPGERSVGGFRLYREEDKERLKRILKMKAMRFSLPAVKEILAVRDVAKEADKVVVLNEVVKRLEEQEQQVDEKIRKRRKEIGHAEDLLRDLRRDVALCKERVRDLKLDPPLILTS